MKVEVNWGYATGLTFFPAWGSVAWYIIENYRYNEKMAIVSAICAFIFLAVHGFCYYKLDKKGCK